MYLNTKIVKRLQSKIPNKTLCRCLITAIEEVPCSNDDAVIDMLNSIIFDNLYRKHGYNFVYNFRCRIDYPAYFFRLVMHLYMLLAKTDVYNQNYYDLFLDAIRRFPPPNYNKKIREEANHRFYVRQFIRLYRGIDGFCLEHDIKLI